ncbi:MAG: hypothetical protein ACRES5_11750 [Pseudomonas sp.]
MTALGQASSARRSDQFWKQIS